MKRGIPLLQRDAIPTIFERAPSYLSQKVTPKRSSPRKRRRLAMEHHENKQTSWLNLDEIKSYNAFKTEVSNKIRSEFPGTELHIQECTDHMLIYKLSDGLDVTLNPKINFAMRILQDLSIKMWISNVEIQSQQLKWILGHTGDKLTLWSQLFEMCRRYQDVPEPDMESRCKYLVNIIEAFGNDIEHEATFNFLAEQCQLFTTSPKGRRYSVDTLSFTYFHKSNACYSELQKMFCVPSKRTLRKISSNLSDHSGIQCETYLKQKVTLLQPHELLVNLMIDEIHIKLKISYQCGKITGTAYNHSETAANRIQAFMVSSVLSKNKDVVSLIPVSKMTAEYLTELIRTVIVNLTKAGFIVCSVISDNNVVNRKAFISLSGLPTLQPFFYNPVNNAKIYVLFDSVHILKCIRNNWLKALVGLRYRQIIVLYGLLVINLFLQLYRKYYVFGWLMSK